MRVGHRPAASAIGRQRIFRHHIETQFGWSIEKIAGTARPYRTVQIKAGRKL
jgi:hypothetical protein